MSFQKIDEGKRGEEEACKFLQKKGFRIIERNFSKRYGEIDIVALDCSNKEQVLVFVEVKTRKSLQFGSPLEAITPWKLRSVIKTAEYYKLTHPKLPEQMRIDAVGIRLNEFDEIEEIEHARNITGF